MSDEIIRNVELKRANIVQEEIDMIQTGNLDFEFATKLGVLNHDQKTFSIDFLKYRRQYICNSYCDENISAPLVGEFL